MKEQVKFNKVFLLFPFFLVFLGLNFAFAKAKQEVNIYSNRKIFIENFKNKTIDQILNGAFIDWGETKKRDVNLTLKVDNNRLQIQNNKNEKEIKNHYIRFIQFPGDNFPTQTNQLNVEAEVSSSSQTSFGAGVFISFLGSNSLNFMVDSKKGFLIAYKAHNGNTTVIQKGNSDFIHGNKVNKISMEIDLLQKVILFKVNNNILSQYPLNSSEIGLNRGFLNQNFVGLATSGKGTFTFHQVVLTKRNKIENNQEVRPGVTASKSLEVEPICDLPQPGENTQIIVLGIDQGKALSNIALENDEINTYAAEINIEKGDKPLYLIALSHDRMIWNFKGATSRLSQVVLISSQSKEDKPIIGAIGVSKNILHFRKSSPCPTFFTHNESIQGIQTKAQLTKLLGKDIDYIYSNQYYRDISVPSLTLNESRGLPIPKGFAAREWRNSISPRTLAGILFFNKKGVLSPVEVISYDLFPGRLGIMQLLDQGVLIRLYGNDDHFKIVKPMKYFPSNLRAIFVLGKGIPFPGGSPGNSTVISEETGEQLYPIPKNRQIHYSK